MIVRSASPAVRPDSGPTPTPPTVVPAAVRPPPARSPARRLLLAGSQPRRDQLLLRPAHHLGHPRRRRKPRLPTIQIGVRLPETNANASPNRNAARSGSATPARRSASATSRSKRRTSIWSSPNASPTRLTLGDDQIDVRRFERLSAPILSGPGGGGRAESGRRCGWARRWGLVSGEPVRRSGWLGAGAGGGRTGAELVRRAEEQFGGGHGWLPASTSRRRARGRASGARTAAGTTVGGVGVGPLPGRTAGGGPSDDQPGTSGSGRRVGVGSGCRTESGPSGDSRPGATSLTGPRLVEGWWMGGCPYRCWSPTTYDGNWFFGRDREVAECLGIADTIGSGSGSGKSSLARPGGPGVAPRQRRGGSSHPGANPRPAARRDDQRVGADHDSKDISCLRRRAGPAGPAAAVVRWSSVAQVVVTLRADHLVQVADLTDLAARVQAGIYLLGAMGELELPRGDEGPGKAGLRLEPGLVDLLVRDVAASPERCRCCPTPWLRPIRREGGSVHNRRLPRRRRRPRGRARAADEVIDSGTGRSAGGPRPVPAPGHRHRDQRPVRQRIPRSTLARTPATDAVLDALVGARLVIANRTRRDRPRSGCRAWPRLRAWLDEDHDGPRLHRHLAARRPRVGTLRPATPASSTTVRVSWPASTGPPRTTVSSTTPSERSLPPVRLAATPSSTRRGAASGAFGQRL